MLWADYLRGRRGLSCHLCGSPQTGSGLLPHQTCLLYCKKALQTESRRQSVGSSETQMDLVKRSQVIQNTSPLRPLPMKILYRSELHNTTPTNFLYHVLLTYWLPLQLLWAELYLKEKGTQIGSPPEDQLTVRVIAPIKYLRSYK